MDFRSNWLPQILGYAEFIVDRDTVYDAWVKEETLRTSIISVHEMFDQMFDDFIDNDILENIANYLPENDTFSSEIAKFIDCTISLEHWVTDQGDDVLPEDVLASVPWLNLSEQAKILLKEANRSGFFSTDFKT